MPTNIQYKTLTIAQKTFRNTETFSKAESVYTPNLFDKHLVNLVKPSTSLEAIEQTILKDYKPLETTIHYIVLFGF